MQPHWFSTLWGLLLFLFLGLSHANPNDVDEHIPDNIKSKMISGEDAVRIRVKGASKSRTLFRGDTRPPDIIFKEGFQPRGTNLDLSLWLGGSSEGGYVSTSRSFKVASSKNYALGGAREEALATSEGRAPAVEGYAYQIDPEGLRGLWIMNAGRPNDPNLEFAVIGEIPAKNIRFAYKVTRNPDGTVKVSEKPFMENNDSKRAALGWFSCLRDQSRVRRQERQCTNWEEEGISDASTSEDVGGQEGRPSERQKPSSKTPSGPADGDIDAVEKPEVCKRDIDCTASEKTQPENKDSEGRLEKTPPAKDYPDRFSEEQLLEVSEKFPEEEFPRMAAKFGLGKLFRRQQNPLSFDKVKVSLKGYKPLSLAPAKIKLKLGKLRAGGNAALLGAGAGIWVSDMMRVFLTNSSASERAVVATSMVPLLGCAVEAAVNEEKGRLDKVDSALCFIGDAFTLTPAWPLGLAIHGVRLLIQVVAPSLAKEKQYNETRDLKLLTQRRFEGWEQHQSELLGRLKSNNFTTNARSQYEAEQLAILYSASQAAGGLRAGSLKTATSKERPRFENTTKYAGQKELEQRICDEFHQRKFLIINDMENGTLAMMQEQQRQYDNQFFKQVKKILDDYPKPLVVVDVFPDPRYFAKVHSEYISKVRSIPYDENSLLPDQARMELRRFLEEKLEFPPPCENRKSKFSEFLVNGLDEEEANACLQAGTDSGQCFEQQFFAWRARQSEGTTSTSVAKTEKVKPLDQEIDMINQFSQDKVNGYSNDRITKCINDNAKPGPPDFPKSARQCFEQQFREWRVKHAQESEWSARH